MKVDGMGSWKDRWNLLTACCGGNLRGNVRGVALGVVCLNGEEILCPW